MAPPGAAAPGAASSGAGQAGQPTYRLPVRRAPRYRRFILTGAVLGALAGMLLLLGADGAGDGARLLVFSVVGSTVLVGGLLAGGMALLTERRRQQRPPRSRPGHGVR